jgi:hypothetical protein
MSTPKLFDASELREIRAFLRADLTQVAQESPEDAFLIGHLTCWPELAQAEAVERARRVLKTFSSTSLIVIANRQVSLPAILDKGAPND